MDRTRARWSSSTKIVVSLLLLALLLYLLFRFSEIIIPFIIATVLAYVISPAVRYLENRVGMKRTPAVLVAYFGLLIFLVILPLVVIPPLVAQSIALNLDLQRALLTIEGWLESEYHIAGQVINVQAAVEQLTVALQGSLEPVFGQTLNLVLEAITSLVWLIFILIVTFYLVKDGPALRAWVEGLVPPDYRMDFLRLRDEISRIWSSFFRGQLILAVVVATIFAVIGFVLGLPFALAMAVLAGLLEFLPSIGHGIWLLCASLLALFVGSAWLPIPNWAFMLLIVGLHLIFQQFDLNYLIPRIIGRSVHLPPLVVILGIVAGAVIGGVVGILLAAPTIASARVLGRYLYANLFDLEPFQSPFTSPLPPPDPQWWRKPAAPKSGHPDRS